MSQVQTLTRPSQNFNLRLRFLKYWTIFAISTRNSMAYVAEALSRTVFLSLILFVLTQLWRNVYSSNPNQTLAGFTLNDVLWYLMLTEVFVVSRTNFNVDIDREVRSGELAYTIVRPYNYMFYQLAVYFGSRLVRMALNVLLSFWVILILSGPPSFLHPENLLGGLWLFLLAAQVDFLMVFILAIQSFWAEDTGGFILIYTRLTMILGGMMLPLDVFPEPLASIAKALPFSYILYLPAHLTVKFDWAQFAEANLKLIVSSLVLSAVALWILRVVERRLTTNGG